MIYSDEEYGVDWDALNKEAESKGYKLHIWHAGHWTMDNFLDSLACKNMWTFYVGESIQNEGTLLMVGIWDSDNHQIMDLDYKGGLLNKYSRNEYVGIFACSSSDYAFDMVMGPTVFAIENTEMFVHTNYLDVYSAGARSLIEGLMNTKMDKERDLVNILDTATNEMKRVGAGTGHYKGEIITWDKH